MSASLDLRGAVREANTIFRRYPVRLSLPMVLFGLLSNAYPAALQSGISHHIFIALLAAFAAFLLNCYVDVGVASMYLRAQDGGEPGAKQLLDVLHYRGFAAVLWGLFLRYFGWILVFGAVGTFIAVFLLIIFNAATSGSSGIGAIAGGVGAGGIGEGIAVVGVVLGMGVAALVLYRYVLVFPMFAIARGSGPGFLEGCIDRTRRVWKTAVLVLLAADIPPLALALMEPLASRHLSPPHAARIAIELAVSILTSCYATWIVGVRTGLALQLTSAQPAPTQQLPTEPSGNQLPDGLVS
ncbi:MAG: hypothetical protein ABR910_02100 [Acidobacteriaceae bacterium]|jgi:hypothetical protein